METNYHYGLFINGELVEVFPDTIEGFHEAVKVSKFKYDGIGEEHEIKVFDVGVHK